MEPTLTPDQIGLQQNRSNNSPPSDNNEKQQHAQHSNDAFASELIPSLTFMIVLMVVGIVGNALVCFVYGFRLRMRTQHFLILALAAFDLLACSISMPAEIADLRYSVMESNESACRVIKFITVYTSMSSSFVLVLIAVDRYIKICRPLKTQMTLRHTKIALVIVMSLACVLTIPSPVLNGSVTTDITNPPLSISPCSTDRSEREKDHPLIYYIVLFFAFMGLVVILTVAYVRIWQMIKKHNIRMRPSAAVSETAPLPMSQSQPSLSSSAQAIDSSVGGTGTASRTDTSGSATANRTVTARTATASRTDTAHRTVTARTDTATRTATANRTATASRPTHAVKTNKTTVIAVTVTLVYFFVFIPFFALILFNDFLNEQRGVGLAFYHLFLRFPFLNSVANPFIYSALNPSFRAECLKLFVWVPSCRTVTARDVEVDSGTESGPGMVTVSSVA